MVAFVISFRRSLCIFLWWIKTWAKVCRNGNKCKAHCILSLEESDYQMIKKLTQNLKHLFRPGGNGRINTNGWCLTGKQNVLFCGDSRNKKHEILPEDLKKKFKMIRVISSFADGPVNFNPTPGPVEDQTQKLISRTEVS